jgi:hypothetical protein
MDQGEQTWSETAKPTGPRIWRTSEVAASDAFDYYREGICSAFMPLRPELDRSLRHSFRATHYAYGIGAGTLNLVTAQSHLVHKGAAEIAASSGDCYYLNFQMAGECRVAQNGTDIVLGPGDVGLFDSYPRFQPAPRALSPAEGRLADAAQAGHGGGHSGPARQNAGALVTPPGLWPADHGGHADTGGNGCRGRACRS